MKKLILFDIDGTLIRHATNVHPSVGWGPFIHAARELYGVTIEYDPTINYHGLVDRQILFDLVHRKGVTKDIFDARYHDVPDTFRRFVETNETKQIYDAIDDAVILLDRIRKRKDAYFLGILTGNVKPMAEWKLSHVGIDPAWFSLFVTGDEFEDRISLAKSVFIRLEKEAGLTIPPNETYVLGDAVGDIRCAHAIGASSIIATTGKHRKSDLLAEHPTLLVDSLMDPRVLSVLGLKHI